MGVIRDFIESKIPESIIPKNVEKIGIGGFSLYASISEGVGKTATITQNPVESGSVISDHIIRNPTTITIQGEVGTVFLKRKRLASTVQQLSPPISTILQYAPDRTATQLTKINDVLQTSNDIITEGDRIFTDGTGIYNYFAGASQQQIFDPFTGEFRSAKDPKEEFMEFVGKLHKSSSIFDIRCVDREFKSFAISSLTTTKDSEGAISFSITAQEIIKVGTNLITLEPVEPSEQAGSQIAETTTKDTAGSKVETSVLSEIIATTGRVFQ